MKSYFAAILILMSMFGSSFAVFYWVQYAVLVYANGMPWKPDQYFFVAMALASTNTFCTAIIMFGDIIDRRKKQRARERRVQRIRKAAERANREGVYQEQVQWAERN